MDRRTLIITGGALVISGGVGIAKSMYVGGNIHFANGKGIDFAAVSNGSGVSGNPTIDLITTTISAGGDVGRETVSQVNTTAGFNICTYSGSGSQSSFGHSLGAAPEWIIIKNRSQADDWFVWVTGLNNNQGLEINTNDAVGTTNGYMGNEAPTSVFVGLGDGHNTNASSENYVAYLWTSIQGYSDFGIYEGTGAADGPFVAWSKRRVQHERRKTRSESSRPLGSARAARLLFPSC